SQVAKATGVFRLLVSCETGLRQWDQLVKDVEFWRDFEHRYAPNSLAESESMTAFVEWDYQKHGRYKDDAYLQHICRIMKNPTLNVEEWRSDHINSFCSWAVDSGNGAVTLPLLLSALDYERKKSHAQKSQTDDVGDRIMADTYRLLAATYLPTDAPKA